MNVFLMIALLSTVGLTQAEASPAVGSSAGIPCIAGTKPMGDDCVPLAEFD